MFFPLTHHSSLITHYSSLITHFLEQPKQLRVDHPYDFSKVFFFLGETVVINIDDEQWTFLVAFDPLIVIFVEALEVVETDVFFIFPAAALDLSYQCGHRSLQVDQQVGGAGPLI